jgi:hypothetical protein
MRIRSRLVFVLILACARVGALPQQAEPDVHADYAPPGSVGTGLTVLQGKVSTKFGTFHFVALKIKKDTHPLTVASALAGYGSGGYGAGDYGRGSAQTLFGIKVSTNAHAVLSGGFMTTLYPPVPLGIVRHNGTDLNRPASGELLNGIVTSDGNRVEIRQFTDIADCLADCLQAGPLLVSDKRVSVSDEYKDQAESLIKGAYRRAFVATLPDGSFILGIASGADLRALAAFLGAPADHGGLGCQDALNLSGSTSAGMLWDHGSEGDTKVPIANALVVR